MDYAVYIMYLGEGIIHIKYDEWCCTVGVLGVSVLQMKHLTLHI